MESWASRIPLEFGKYRVRVRLAGIAGVGNRRPVRMESRAIRWLYRVLIIVLDGELIGSTS